MLLTRMLIRHDCNTALLLADDTSPKVNSISYGWQGDMSQLGCEATSWKEVDANFMKLATMGVTVLFASGDSGSGTEKKKNHIKCAFILFAQYKNEICKCLPVQPGGGG